MYKMLKPPKGREVTYLRIVSAPRWQGGDPSAVHIPELKIGSITWTFDFTSERVILEENQFSINFDSKCFEKIEYRFKTKEEFLDEGRWDSSEIAPEDWNHDMNKYLGKLVPSEFYGHCNESRNFQYEGWHFDKNDYTDKPLVKTTLETKESLYRFKTEEEFRRDGLWHDSDGVPKYWNSSGKMNQYIGKTIDSDYNTMCDDKQRITIHDEYAKRNWAFRSEDYVLRSDFPLREDPIRLIPHEIEDIVFPALDVPEHSDLLSTNKEVLDENPYKKVDEFIQREKDEKQKTSVKSDFTQMININI